jgi:hypothetical protein
VTDKWNVETERAPTESTFVTGAMSNLVSMAQGDPWQMNLSILNTPNLLENLWFTVPEGKTLAITSATVRLRVPSGQHVTATLGVNGPPGLVMGFEHFVMVHQGTFNASDIFTGSHSMLLWVNGFGGLFEVRRSAEFDFMGIEVAAAGFFVA